MLNVQDKRNSSSIIMPRYLNEMGEQLKCGLKIKEGGSRPRRERLLEVKYKPLGFFLELSDK